VCRLGLLPLRAKAALDASLMSAKVRVLPGFGSTGQELLQTGIVASFGATDEASFQESKVQYMSA
jgi:hypothetical protein